MGGFIDMQQLHDELLTHLIKTLTPTQMKQLEPHLAPLVQNAAQRASSTRPSSRPFSVRRRSALSSRRISRYSAREVNMRYGSWVPRVIRSSTSTPM